MRYATLVLLLALGASAQEPIPFESVLDRALEARGVENAFLAGIEQLENPPGRTFPTLRAEAAAQTAENIEILSDNAVRFDALTLILSLDYPLLDRGARNRHVSAARTSALLFRRRALDEAEEVFRETLDAYTDLYVAQERLRMMEEGLKHAALLRERAQTMLELGQITNTVAADWEEQALAFEQQRLDLDIRRIEAETRLRQLTGDSRPGPLLAQIELGKGDQVIRTVSVDEMVERDAIVDRATLYEAQKRLVVDELRAQKRPQLLLSAFGGAATVPEVFRSVTREGSYGIYGVRLSFTLPTSDAAARARIAQAELELEEATRMRTAAANSIRTRGNLLAVSLEAADKRLELLERSVDLAKQRQDSMIRLVLGGVRSQSDLVEAVTEVARRESDLLAVRVERWRLAQTAKRMQTQKKTVVAAR